MDNASINIVEDARKMGLDRTAGALLVIQSDAPGAACGTEIEIAEAACAKHGAIECFATDDPDEGELFVEARRAFFPALEGRGALMLEDVGAPVPQLPALLTGIEKIAANRAVDIPVVAHAGDGNTHPTIVFDPTDDAAKERAAIAFTEIMELAISLGGTITGEHGIGRLKKELLPTQLGSRVMELNRQVKQLLDPTTSSTRVPASSQRTNPHLSEAQHHMWCWASDDSGGHFLLTTTVPAARSWRPRRSGPITSAGMTRQTSRARPYARSGPSGSRSIRTTAILARI